MPPVNKIIITALMWVLSAGVIFNFSQSALTALSHAQDRTTIPLHSLAAQFDGLKETFKGLRYAGYYTDKDTEAPLTLAQFQQAQYTLAPTVFILNKTNYPLVIFDCTTTDVAVAKMKELGFAPIKSYNGIILGISQKLVQP